jgi:Pyruvate/2-oxoacid:ferredoxin oxidoreductase gamma subunit
MGKLRNFNVSWLPSYGPEMRGGTANCSVILSRKVIGSPIIDKNCNLLIVLNQPSMDKFLPELKENGVLIYDSTTINKPECSPDKKVYAVDASDIAKKIGSLKYANSVILGALAAVMDSNFLTPADQLDFNRTFEEAIMDCFSNKETIIKKNIEAFHAGKREVINARKQGNEEL